MENKLYIRLNEADQVAVALKNLAKGTLISVDNKVVTLKADIPFGHKFALEPIAKGHDVLKYGLPIGHATCDIEAGDYVHTHNLESNYNLIDSNGVSYKKSER